MHTAERSAVTRAPRAHAESRAVCYPIHPTANARAVKQKMLYANAKDTLRKKLPGDSFGQESHWSAMDEVMMGGAAALSGVDVQHVMTEAERMVLHEDMSSAAEAAAGKALPAPRAPMRARGRFWHRAPPPSLPAPSHPAPAPLFSRCACAGNRLHSSRRARPPGR